MSAADLLSSGVFVVANTICCQKNSLKEVVSVLCARHVCMWRRRRRVRSGSVKRGIISALRDGREGRGALVTVAARGNAPCVCRR